MKIRLRPAIIALTFTALAGGILAAPAAAANPLPPTYVPTPCKSEADSTSQNAIDPVTKGLKCWPVRTGVVQGLGFDWSKTHATYNTPTSVRHAGQAYATFTFGATYIAEAARTVAGCCGNRIQTSYGLYWPKSMILRWVNPAKQNFENSLQRTAQTVNQTGCAFGAPSCAYSWGVTGPEGYYAAFVLSDMPCLGVNIPSNVAPINPAGCASYTPVFVKDMIASDTDPNQNPGIGSHSGSGQGPGPGGLLVVAAVVAVAAVGGAAFLLRGSRGRAKA